jgi:hypothetical protein
MIAQSKVGSEEETTIPPVQALRLDHSRLSARETRSILASRNGTSNIGIASRRPGRICSTLSCGARVSAQITGETTVSSPSFRKRGVQKEE